MRRAGAPHSPTPAHVHALSIALTLALALALALTLPFLDLCSRDVTLAVTTTTLPT